MYLSLCLAKYSGFMAYRAHEGGTWDSIKGEQTFLSKFSLTCPSMHLSIYSTNLSLWMCITPDTGKDETKF